MPEVGDIGIREFEGDGDFRSSECIELLKQADIVVTNTPFSLFREYVAQLVQYGKKFLIVGSQNAITYKEIFPLIKDNRLWLGVTPKGQDMLFDVPEGYAQELTANKKEGSAYRLVDGVVKGRLGNAAWFTNLDHAKRHEELILYKRYSPEEYPTYDNYDAINVDRVADIPMDWDGAMGVPVTFLDKHNPEQFDLLGVAYLWDDSFESHNVLRRLCRSDAGRHKNRYVWEEGQRPCRLARKGCSAKSPRACSHKYPLNVPFSDPRRPTREKVGESNRWNSQRASTSASRRCSRNVTVRATRYGR